MERKHEKSGREKVAAGSTAYGTPPKPFSIQYERGEGVQNRFLLVEMVVYMTGEQSYRYYNEFLWPDRYADCVPMDKALKLLKSEVK